MQEVLSEYCDQDHDLGEDWLPRERDVAVRLWYCPEFHRQRKPRHADGWWRRNDPELEKTFRSLADEWTAATAFLSSIQKKCTHLAYQRIIGLGKPVVPLILEELRDRGGQWFWALHAITGQDVSLNSQSVGEAKAAWLDWGRRHGYIE